MLEKKVLEYYLLAYIKTFGRLPILEILSEENESAQYVNLVIFLTRLLKEMEDKFFNERIPPEEFIMQKFKVPFLAFWGLLEKPEDIIRSSN